MSYLTFIIKNMKEKLIIISLIMIYSSLTTPIISKYITNSSILNENSIEISIAEDIWDYLSRFTINN